MNPTQNIFRMPCLFVSHGAPTLAIEEGPAHRFLREYGKQAVTPGAIVVISAHFEAPVVTVTAAQKPETIYDFRGFPDTLYKITYPAPGDPALAGKIAGLLEARDLQVVSSPTRGLDHGAWVPLFLMFPEANIPVVQVSIDPRQGAEYHYQLGKLLAPLRDEGVLIIGSGGATHNLAELNRHQADSAPPEWVASFNDWLDSAVVEGRTKDLLHYREFAPNATKNHPTEEHFFPLLCTLGAAATDRSRARVHHSYTFGVLSMDAYQFGDSNCEHMQ